MSAWINGFLGLFLTLAIGTLRLGFEPLDAFWCAAASNISGFLALMAYSKANRVAWTKRHVVFNPFSTWLFFLTTYFGLELLLAPQLRVAQNFMWLAFPTMMVTGFAILAYGPIQDRIVSSTATS